MGDFLRAVRETGLLRERTFLNYQNCFRTIIAESFGISLKPGESKFDYRTGGNAKWTARIDEIRLERITPDRIADWQKQRVKRAGNSPSVAASAKQSANSYVRCARSLFGADVKRALLGITLPAVLPFDEVKLVKAGSTKFISRCNVKAVIAAARVELKDADLFAIQFRAAR